MSIVFSQASIFHLYRLGLVVSGKTGKKYSLSNEAEMLALIKRADTSSDLSINRQFNAFISTLEPNLRAEMYARGYLRRRQSEVHTPSLQERLLRKRAS